MKTNILLGATMASFLLCASSSAASLFTEDFEYVDGTIGTVATGFAGGVNDWDVSSGTLVWDGNGVNSLRKNITETADDTIYFSSFFSNTGPDDNYTQTVRLIESTGGTTFVGEFGIRNNEFFADINLSGVSTVGSYVDGSTALIVGKLQFNATGNETLTIWVNPTAEETSSITTTVIAETNETTMNRVQWQGLGLGAGNELTFDSLRIGTSWADVTAIPEPSTHTFVGVFVGMLGMVFIRRKRFSDCR